MEEDLEAELIHQPCPDCKSSDALTINTDGSSKCYACDKFTPNREKGEAKGQDDPSHKPVNKDLLSGSYSEIAARKLSKETCQKWGVELVELSSGEKALAFPYYDVNNKKTAQKIRTASRGFSFIGKSKDPQLFGQQLWSKGKKIVITEGEIDAMSVSQLQNNKWPVVSLPNGAASAVKAIENNLRWLEENFEEIILMFDMDEVGQEAALKVAPKFTPGKCSIAHLPLKDANECLMAGQGDDVINAIWNPKPYRPDGVVTISDVIPKLDEKPEYGYSLPWEQLTDLTYGIRLPAVWVWISGSGMGKTEFFKDIAAHLVKEKVKVGMILLEEEPQETVVALAGKMVGKCFNAPDIPYNHEERTDAVKLLEDSDSVYLYDHFGHDDYAAIKSVVRHMVVACGCKVIFLDHITAFTDGLEGREANALAEKMMKELSSMARELKFNLQVISHVRKSDSSRKPAEEGGRVKIDDAKGSGAIKQWSNVVVGLERNQQSEDKDEARTTTVRILKSRGAGKNVGETVQVKYLPETAQLIQSNEVFGEDLPF